ncbi:tetratricopeptide repeat protein [Polynucleobacter rarus]|uniref:tetratricopeptide repeat protein n=1 Tax=Polynucleobacter rarus TaxID=556055 RepID=UPI000D3E518D|nr:tetratricopeptide repeat protein [Polynucleobacter rarus]
MCFKGKGSCYFEIASLQFLILFTCLNSPLVFAENTKLIKADSVSLITTTEISDVDEVLLKKRLDDVYTMYEKGNSSGVIEDGVPLLKVFPNETRLRFALANSLVWSTPRFEEAIALYKTLLTSEYAKESKLGLANAYRWTSRDDLAMPYYRELIAANPEDENVNEGYKLSTMAMRAMTTYSFGTSSDSNTMQRNEASVSHKFRNEKGEFFEVSIRGIRDTTPSLVDTNGNSQETIANQRSMTFRYQNINLPLSPTFELTAQTKDNSNAFGGVELQINKSTKLVLNRINWGVLSFNANAAAANLSAGHAALESSYVGRLGSVSGRVDYFAISDGNHVTSSYFQASPSFSIGKNIKPFIGIQTRDQAQYSPVYWSPMEGYGVYFGGLRTEWTNNVTTLSISAQYGMKLYGDGARNYSVFTKARTKVTDDFAASITAAYSAGGAYGPEYTYSSIMGTIEQLW